MIANKIFILSAILGEKQQKIATKSQPANKFANTLALNNDLVYTSAKLFKPEPNTIATFGFNVVFCSI